MELTTANFLVNAIRDQGNEAEVREDYSGRGMLGRTTSGIVVESQSGLLTDVVAYIKKMGQENPQFIFDIPDMPHFREDSMGRDMILY
jgi:hypothetical protein